MRPNGPSNTETNSNILFASLQGALSQVGSNIASAAEKWPLSAKQTAVAAGVALAGVLWFMTEDERRQVQEFKNLILETKELTKNLAESRREGEELQYNLEVLVIELKKNNAQKLQELEEKLNVLPSKFSPSLFIKKLERQCLKENKQIREPDLKENVVYFPELKAEKSNVTETASIRKDIREQRSLNEELRREIEDNRQTHLKAKEIMAEIQQLLIADSESNQINNRSIYENH